MKKVFFAICFVALIISPVYAVDKAAVGTTSISLTDSGSGPGVSGVAKSMNSYVVYSAAASAGYGSGAAGQVMAVVAYSAKANKDVQLTIGTRASNDVSVADDNTIYQLPSAGTARTTANADGYVTDATMAGWMVRGGS